MGWGHDGSLVLLMMGTDYDSDRRWSLHAVCSKTSRRKQYEQAEGDSFTAHLLSLDMLCLMLYSIVLGTLRKKQPETWKSAMEQSFKSEFQKLEFQKLRQNPPSPTLSQQYGGARSEELSFHHFFTLYSGCVVKCSVTTL